MMGTSNPVLGVSEMLEIIKKVGTPRPFGLETQKQLASAPRGTAPKSEAFREL